MHGRKFPTREQRVKTHYNKSKRYQRNERKELETINIRKVNNFIKKSLINQFVKTDDKVFDLCCGKGGDIFKFKDRKIEKYIGVDISQYSVDEAKKRYETNKSIFEAEFFCRDAYDGKLELKESIDFISCQFSFHYAFESENKVKNAILSTTKTLKKGGFIVFTVPDDEKLLAKKRKLGDKFGNSYFEVEFLKNEKETETYGIEYNFTLKDSIESCSEFLVKNKEFIELMKSLNFNCVLNEKFKNFFSEKRKNNKNLFTKMCGENFDLTKDEKEVINLYRCIAFEKIND